MVARGGIYGDLHGDGQPVHRAAVNTDRELWRGPDEGNRSYYADSIHVTLGGGIGMNVGGHVIVMRPREWHSVCKEAVELRTKLDTIRDLEPGTQEWVDGKVSPEECQRLLGEVFALARS